MDCTRAVYSVHSLFRRYKSAKRVIDDRGWDVANHFFELEALNKVEHFMSWALESQEQIDKFREGLAHSKRFNVKSIISSNDAELEKHFKWCAKGDQGLIIQFKTKFPWFYGALIRDLIVEDEYERLDKVLNWYFLENQMRIALFKSNMYKDNSLSFDIVRIISRLLRKHDCFKMLNLLGGVSPKNRMHKNLKFGYCFFQNTSLVFAQIY